MQKIKQMLAVIVLYKVRAEESVAWPRLARIMQSDETTAAAIDVMICDNTPWEQLAPAGFDGLYLRDTTNPGLAKSYNIALGRAAAMQTPWLLLLDQDTSLTAEYVAEAVALAESLRGDEQIAAIVPKLVQDGDVLSPHLSLTFRHPRSLDRKSYGTSSAVRIHPYNSGAVVRVSALQAIGGFPETFWLDYLDHATFQALQSRGGWIFVMHSMLEHELSSNETERPDDEAYVARQQNVLEAEYAFYRDYGTPQDRIYYHARMFWRALKALCEGSPARSARLLKVAIRL